MNERSLPRQRAFVVQFHAEASLAPERCVGRVEHVASGQAARFGTLEELLAFMGQVLTDLGKRPCEEV
ncbi:MAG: hypothetical protein ACREOH_16195 [Candidatus Entotheonellia bacterium]